jgi:hypothetical protein
MKATEEFLLLPYHYVTMITNQHNTCSTMLAALTQTHSSMTRLFDIVYFALDIVYYLLSRRCGSLQRLQYQKQIII